MGVRRRVQGRSVLLRAPEVQGYFTNVRLISYWFDVSRSEVTPPGMTLASDPQ